MAEQSEMPHMNMCPKEKKCEDFLKLTDLVKFTVEVNILKLL